ncbi:DUF1349 domain-containing protein [Cellulosimicrobium terreum]|nr:DUF1349 domain-containing protein [Cellulosimicrobium terreum]
MSGRRAVLAWAAALALASSLAVPAADGATAAGSAAAGSGTAAAELPVFTSTGQIVDPYDETLPHNPNKEFIFPSVFHAGEHLEDPLGEWYIYYAPHDAPGGINLMYADSLDGPWTQYEQSPVIANEWEPHYSVSHVSSPDAFWNADEGRMYLYFHGENTVSRYATSSDGVTFTYGGDVVTTEQVDAAQPGRSALETSYGRVFEMPEPTAERRYGMFFMINYSNNVRHIGVAFSPDGRAWEVQPEPIVDPTDVEGTNVSGADLWEWGGQHYIVYGSTVGTIFARTIDPQLTATGDPQPLYVPAPAPPEAGRSASPQIVTADGETHLFYEYGERSHTTIAHAVLDPDGVRDPLNQHPQDPMYAQCPAPGSDGFDGESLDPARWAHVVRGTLRRDTVSGGTLHVPTYTGNSTSAPLVLQQAPAGTWEMTTRLTLDPVLNYQQAGLIAYQDDASSARVGYSFAAGGKQFTFIWRHDGVDRSNTWTMEDSALAPQDMGEDVWLRMTNHGTSLTASYSLDGATFVNLGRSAPTADLSPVGVGPFAYRGGAGTPEISADFDWFRLTPDADQLAACADDEPAVDVRVESRCLAGRAYVAATARNDDDAPAAIRLSTPVGERTFDDVAPGRSAYQSFPTRQIETGAGTVTVDVLAPDDGAATWSTTVPFDAVTCT